jgi:hypothetical protein
LLLYVLLQQSSIRDIESRIGLSKTNSYVFHQGKWIDIRNLSHFLSEPVGLKIIFDANSVEKK